jgi:hypothetical protein
MGKKPKVPTPQDPLAIAGKQSGQLLGYYGTEVPKWIQLQSRLGPQLMGQMFDQSRQFLGGVGGQAGYEEMLRQAGLSSGQTIGELRAEELQQMTGQTGQVRDLMAALSPEQAASVSASAQEAERARISAQGVTPEEQRMYQQTAREAAQAAGRLGGNRAIAAEVMGREDTLQRKREQAATAGARSYELARNFYTQPGLTALSQAPISYGAGQQTLGQALTMGPASSGQFDYNAPLNFAQQRASALDKQAMAQFEANQKHRAQTMGLITQGIGLAAAPFTGGLSLGLGSMMSQAGAGMGSTGLFNAGANLFNMGAGAGTPLKATIV